MRYSLLKFWHMHVCGKGYKYFSPHCCKCNSFGCIAALRCGNACQGPHSYSVYSGSEQRQFNSPRLFKREAGFLNPWRALIGSNQLWRIYDSPYYREFLPLALLLRIFLKIIANMLQQNIILSFAANHYDQVTKQDLFISGAVENQMWLGHNITLEVLN